MNPQLQRAIHAAKEGHHATARRLLLQVLEQEPENEVAWMWMAYTVEDRERRRQALERVLEINPDNERAQQELAKLRSRPTPPPVEQTKKCPYCAETIKAEAIVCRYCGRDLAKASPKQPTQKQQPEKKSRLLPALLLLVGLLFCCGIFYSGDGDDGTGSPNGQPGPTATEGPTPTPRPDRIGAWVICEQFVEERLVAPTTAEFGNYQDEYVTVMEDQEYLVLGQVDAQNSFGAMIRSSYACHVRDNGDDTWSLIDLAIE